MKKFNINSILFLFAVVFIADGIWGNCYTQLDKNAEKMFTALRHRSMKGVLQARDNIDKVSSEALNYHDELMDIDSLRNNLLGTRVVIKEDSTVVKSDSGSLCDPISRIDDEEITAVIARILELKNVSEENGAKFLYCAAPGKEIYEELPVNVRNYGKDNFDRYLEGLRASEIPVLDFREVFKENNAAAQDIYYYTDHHWQIRSGFQAYAAICRELSSRYGFEYDERAADLRNFSVVLYPDWFLGSKGKKVGTYFTWHGADDFELITPKFETDMKEEQPLQGLAREGTFEETALHMDRMEKDYYVKNTYATYSGGDYRLQIMTNKLNPDGKKILIVKDSFACAVTPFLSLQTSELYVSDIRNGGHYVGEKANLAEFIPEIRPDYVLVLYVGISIINTKDRRYDFF